MKSPKQTGKDIWAAVAKEAGYAVNDIRQKAVEEPWFDKRAITPAAELWANTAPDENAQEHEQGIEREELYGEDISPELDDDLEQEIEP